MDVTLEANGKNFETGYRFSDLSEDGRTLAKFGLMMRSHVCVPFYIDSITYTLAENTTPPVLENRSGETLYLHDGAPLLLNARAIDPEEGELALQYEWSDPAAQNPDGTLNRGEYVLTVYATDYFGNRAEQTLTVKVGEADVERPAIMLRADTIRAVVGTRPVLLPTVRDNSGFADVDIRWSVGALDVYGGLTAGTHQFAVVATDSSGNVSQRVLSVTVSAAEDWGSTVIDEENPQLPVNPPVGDDENEGGASDDNDQSNNDQGNNNDPIEEPGILPSSEPSDKAQPQTADHNKLYVGIGIGVACGAILISLIFGLIMGARKKDRDYR